MKILNDSNGNDNKVVRCRCPECGCEYELNLDVDKEYYEVDKYEVPVNYICPSCGYHFDNEERTVTFDNICYPFDFFHFGSSNNAYHVTDDEIKTMIQSVLKNIRVANGEDFSYIATGDTIVVGFKFEDEVTVIVAKNYFEGTINNLDY